MNSDRSSPSGHCEPAAERQLSELSRVSDVYQPHPVVAGVETMRWLPTEHGIHTMSVVTGAKWNLTRSWLVNTNLLIRLTDTGLSARVTPSLVTRLRVRALRKRSNLSHLRAR
jgi:hypothetical protein